MTAIQIDGAGRFAVTGICVRIQIHVQPGTVAGVSVVLVVVVTEVFDPGLNLVPTVRRHRRPTELERQEGEQDDGEKTAHNPKFSGYKIYLGSTELTEAWGFTVSMPRRKSHGQRRRNLKNGKTLRATRAAVRSRQVDGMFSPFNGEWVPAAAENRAPCRHRRGL